ncbi:hypothetical protein MUO69_03230 [Candidatus Bathyarchaeota archaeon]|nr:hypothetical protein [Candidatus Bathyarchaeota archaeon]
METQPESLEVRKKAFFTMARDVKEYQRSVIPTEELVESLRKRNVDIFTFIERKWCCPIASPSKSWLKAEDNIALLAITSYDDWLKIIGKKTRNMIRKAEKSGTTTRIAEPNEKLAEGIWKIYNETPIRQERGFPHYGVSLKAVTDNVLSTRDCVYIGAYLQDELVGFIQLVQGDNIVIVSQILSMQKHWDKALNNALVAKAVEVCTTRKNRWLMYGRMGNHPTLDDFKQNNGCVRFLLTRYFIVLTGKGRLAARLGLHREMKDALPLWLKRPLFPVYNWVSRTRMRIKTRSMPMS